MNSWSPSHSPVQPLHVLAKGDLRASLETSPQDSGELCPEWLWLGISRLLDLALELSGVASQEGVGVLRRKGCLEAGTVIPPFCKRRRHAAEKASPAEDLVEDCLRGQGLLVQTISANQELLFRREAFLGPMGRR